MATPAARTATLAEALREVVDFRLTNVHTVLPGRIQSYDSAKQTAEVVLCLKRRVHTESGDDILEDFPPLPNVRIEFPQTASFFMSFPLAANDFVWVHFGEQSLDAWYDRGGTNIEDPVDRRFDLSDAFAVPARDPSNPIGDTNSSAIVIGAKGGTNARAYFKQSIIALGEENPSEFVALATKVFNEINALRSTVNAHATAFNTHTHTGVTTGPGSSGTPASAFGAPATVNSVASSTVKAK